MPLYVTCYRDMAWDSNSRAIGAPMEPAISEQIIDITHESIQGDKFPEWTHFVIVKATEDCAIAFGENPEADPSYHILEAGERTTHGVRAGHRVAVIEVIKGT